jgi:pyridoxamine 5'-phosphate oxidase
MDPAALRREYRHARLDETSVLPDPIAQFQRWFAEAAAAGVAEPNAMTLATTDGQGRPSARIVLLKGLDGDGFVFFTDFRSRKGRELAGNPQAALVFWWEPLERQVRIEGRVRRLDEEAAWVYFRTRPEGSRIGAWASEQSSEIPDRAALEARVAEQAAAWAGREVSLPPHWGGFRLAPDALEFWQGRPDRLHDRIAFTRTTESGWRRARLSP